MLEVSPREFLAFHEAGHAVMALILGRTVHRASIRRTHGLSGHVDFDHAISGLIEVTEQIRPLIESDALVLLAGRAAECERTMGCPLSHAGTDRENTRSLLRIIENCDEVVSSWTRYLLVRAQSMLQENWPLVYSVARALLRDEELDSVGIARTIAACREQMTTREPSNCRIMISERALEAIREVPQPECAGHLHPANGGLLRFPDQSAASGRPAEEARRGISEVMHLSARARNCLARHGIMTLGDLSWHTVRDLQSIRALGPKTLHEIMAELRRLGITLPVALKGTNR